jgi:hypothetical protein
MDLLQGLAWTEEDCMTWTSVEIGGNIEKPKGKVYTVATEGGKNKYAGFTMLDHLQYDKLAFDNLSGTFEVTDAIEGATSEATADVRRVFDGYLLVTNVAGTFQNDEQIEGSGSGATADVDGSLDSGEPLVDQIWTQVLGSATVVVDSAGAANETVVDTKMADYET